jgi:hypothetical protein
VTPLSALLLPILLSAVAVFILSSIIHMMSPWHKSDYPALANEDALSDAVRPLTLPPGDYMVPRPAGAADLKTEAFKAKMDRGPNLILTVIPNGRRSMVKPLIGWLVYILVVTILAAQVAAWALPVGATSGKHRYVGIVSLIGYSLALFQFSIWYHRKLSTTIKSAIDGLIYAAVTALIFGWLWPR